MAEAVQPSGWSSLVDMDRVAGWMDDRGLPGGAIGDVVELAGGTQNLLLRFSRGSRQYVLRHPPAHAKAAGNRTMQREIQVLTALGGTDVPHPRLIAGCNDTAILGAVFYLMEPVEGFCPCTMMPPFHASDPAVRHRMGLSLVEGALALARVDPVKHGLSSLGRVEDFIQRQASRWSRQLLGYHDHEGWPGPQALGDIETISKWLEANLPTTFQPGLMHGDYHLANVMYRLDSGELAAIVDWELASQGDPLLDLGWMLATWPDPDGASCGPEAPQPWQGFPTREELLAHYTSRSHRDLTHLRWYGVLACYKAAILFEGSNARACAGKAPMATGAMLHDKAVRLVERAHSWMEAGSAPF